LNMDKTLIEKYLNDSCNEQELDLVLSWLTESADSADGKDILYRIWEELPENGTDIKIDFDAILNKIHHEVNVNQTKLLMKKSEDGLIKYNRRQYVIRTLRNVAAVLLFPVLGLGLFYYVKYYSARSAQMNVSRAYNEIFSSVDAISKVTLPDGSSVWLNHSSSLRYPAVFTGKYRSVELKGEGYFEVARNSKSSFIVHSGELQVLAYGTSFNVMAYPDENKIETSLITGNVELRKSLPGGKTTTLCKMNPADHTIFYSGNGEVITKTISDDRYFSWKDGKLIFTAEPLDEVVRKLSRWFNVDIIIKDPELKDLTLTATFVHETLPQVMELLCRVSPVRYSISNREEKNDGTFTRRKVILTCLK